MNQFRRQSCNPEDTFILDSPAPESTASELDDRIARREIMDDTNININAIKDGNRKSVIHEERTPYPNR